MDYLEFTIDKFTFRTARDRQYSAEGLWVKQEAHNVRIGLSDYLQQRSGDMAFVEIKPVGTEIAYGDELVTLETIKVSISLVSPVSGRVIDVNPAMETMPELANQDPYGAGWMVLIEAFDLDKEYIHLLSPEDYFAMSKDESTHEAKKD